VVIIALGYPQPGAPMSLGAKRKPVEEYVSWEKWGQREIGGRR